MVNHYQLLFRYQGSKKSEPPVLQRLLLFTKTGGSFLSWFQIPVRFMFVLHNAPDAQAAQRIFLKDKYYTAAPKAQYLK